MIIKEVNQEYKDDWNRKVSHPLQTWEWGEFRKKTGNRVIRLGVFTRKKLVSGYQITLHHVPFTPLWIGVFLKGPHPTQIMLSALKEFGISENLVLIRMEPNVIVSTNGKRKEGADKLEKILRSGGTLPGRPFFTKYTSLIDLTRTEDELLASFHPKTRYNIKVAQRRGVEVVEDESKRAFETYLALMEETTRRQGFYAHTEKYHRLMWETLNQDMSGSGQAPIARLLVAKYKDEILSAWILFVWRDFLYYPYGASSAAHRNLMANNLMLWEAIKFGKRLGLSKFDLWGSLGQNPSPADPWYGWHRFKSGYNPILIEFLGTWDLVISPRIYPAVRLLEEVRWRILRLRTKLPIKTPGPSFK